MSQTTLDKQDTSAKGTEAFDELATLREIERILRAYDARYFAPIHSNDEFQFHPGTVRMMEAVHPLLEHLEEGRRPRT